ncbi:isocitrate dehydrogenase kinase/phosphatase-domain containing protein, partial [Salmonella enterica]|uniref:isocitrate dehydrogenase kinase/phosphatase-domain containing protein n=1 Tax=Salmonella enterica TaxID=28901 RepID=UPI00398C34C8
LAARLHIPGLTCRDKTCSRFPEAERSADPCVTASVAVVLPEEFCYRLCADRRFVSSVEERHADVVCADYWRALQTRSKEGHVEDVYAYRRSQRFSVRYGAITRTAYSS